MYQDIKWKQNQKQASVGTRLESAMTTQRTNAEDTRFKRKIKSWRYLSFFKKNGLLIKFSFAQQTIYLSFVKKTTETKYQSFTDGFVVKLTLDSLNELLFCMSLNPPQQWDTWREKDGEKFHVFITPLQLKEFTLMSGTRINIPALALTMQVQYKKTTIHRFTLAPAETALVLDAFQAFRNQVLHNIISNTPDTRQQQTSSN